MSRTTSSRARKRKHKHWTPRAIKRSLICLVTMLAAATFAAAPAGAEGACDKFASTTGSDSASGDQTQPLRTAQKLVNSLANGQTGCLRAGSYSGSVTISNGGVSGAPITLTSYPGEQATIKGRLWVKDSANFVNVSSLKLDGSGYSLPSPVINGDDFTLSDSEVTNNSSAICISVGATTYGRAYRTTVERNRVHDCGRLPAANHDHGIYLENSTDARIVDNVFYDNADRGIQLYPDAERTYVARNIIDGNGTGIRIGGGNEEFGCKASNNNTIENNLITNNLGWGVDSWWGCSSLIGQDNVVRDSCFYGNGKGRTIGDGYTVQNALAADPLYVNRAAKDFRLQSDSPCLSILGGTPTPPPPPADTTAPSVSVTAPAGGATVSGTVPLTATASDDVGIAGVQFRLDGVNLAGEEVFLPYAVSWDTTTTGDGFHVLTAMARDQAGNTTQSAPITVTVSNLPEPEPPPEPPLPPPPDPDPDPSPDPDPPVVTNLPPTVEITSPADGLRFRRYLKMSATATDDHGVARVEFWVGGKLRVTDTTAPYSRKWRVKKLAYGSHKLTIKAFDQAGLVAADSITVKRVRRKRR